jgi:hypothetical protein
MPSQFHQRLTLVAVPMMVPVQVRVPAHEAEVAMGLHDPRGAYDCEGCSLIIPGVNDPVWGFGGCPA